MAKIANTAHKKVIDDVFRKLKEDGILVLKGKEDCGTCTIAKLEQTIKDKNLKPNGYAWFHRQDIEHFNADSKLYIGFNGSENNTLNCLDVGNLIATYFRESGCEIDWDGTPIHRVGVIFNHRGQT